MFEDLAQVPEDFGVLKHVRLTEFEPGWVTAVRFQFESGVLTIEEDGSGDTIRWHLSHSADSIDETPSAWSWMLSSRVRWVWVLTNHRGYRDALQLELSRDGQSTYVQFLVEGSRLRIYRLEGLVT